MPCSAMSPIHQTMIPQQCLLRVLCAPYCYGQLSHFCLQFSKSANVLYCGQNLVLLLLMEQSGATLA